MLTVKTSHLTEAGNIFWLGEIRRRKRWCWYIYTESPGRSREPYCARNCWSKVITFFLEYSEFPCNFTFKDFKLQFFTSIEYESKFLSLCVISSKFTVGYYFISINDFFIFGSSYGVTFKVRLIAVWYYRFFFNTFCHSYTFMKVYLHLTNNGYLKFGTIYVTILCILRRTIFNF